MKQPIQADGRCGRPAPLGPSSESVGTTGYDRKILTQEAARRREAEGWHWADLHVHTFFSEDVLPVPSSDPACMLQRARALGLRYVSFTDHDTMDAYDRVGWHREGLVPGVEMRIRDRRRVGHTIHVNVYLLDRRQFLEAREIAHQQEDLERFLDYLRANNLPHTYNHPFWFEAGEEPNVSAVPRVARLFPVLEYNRGRVLPLNRLTLGMAERYGKGVVCNSDTHTLEGLGTARTCARGDTFREFFGNVRRGDAFLLTRDLTVPHLIEEVNEWIRQIFGHDLREGAPGALEAGLNVKHLNWLVRSLREGVLAERPWLRRRVERLLQTVSNSGVIQQFYVNAESARAEQIHRTLAAA